ncbi:hypothetical protein TrispH2_009830 [Trichoplax sp. H2]|nr:hypothetical protein TrispH2_009830 [Trichoplax sp. H2]|eukprot:RDD38194.1 hypothetical protein TrispH2_009830 [Trichoplax sp. H2]
MNEIENSLEYLNTIRRVQHYRQNHENYFDKSTKPRTHYENIDFVGVILVHVADIKEDCYNLHDVEKEVLNSVIAFDFRKAEGTVPVWGFDLPQPLAYLAACIYNGEIYITGGLNEDRQCSNKVWKLSVVVDNYIYIGGGLDDNEELITTFERYDPIHNTWNFVYDITASNLSIRLLYARSILLIYRTQSFHKCYMQSLDGKWYKTSDYKISEFSREINDKDYITDGYIAIKQITIEYGFLIPSCKWRRNIKIFDAIPKTSSRAKFENRRLAIYPSF